MLTKRIIPCLDIRSGRTVKGIKFEQIRDAGDPVELAATYAEQGADELVFLDITASVERRATRLQWVRAVAAELNIPFTVGGGISGPEDVFDVLRAGADKISVNSAAVKNPELISTLAREFGSQCVVLAIDARKEPHGWEVFVKGGREPAGMDLYDWAKQGEALGAGEILFTSMDHDGTKAGFACEALDALCDAVNIPVIASGGAGTKAHFREVFASGKVDAALAASVFHYGEIPIPSLKDHLRQSGIHVRV